MCCAQVLIKSLIKNYKLEEGLSDAQQYAQGAARESARVLARDSLELLVSEYTHPNTHTTQRFHASARAS
jgi:hypothetical protein